MTQFVSPSILLSEKGFQLFEAVLEGFRPPSFFFPEGFLKFFKWNYQLLNILNTHKKHRQVY